MTARFVTVGVMLTAVMALAIPASGAARAGDTAGPCRCAQPSRAQASHAQAPSAKARPPVRSKARHRAARISSSQAYAESFYNYWANAPVSTTGWHGQSGRAPHAHGGPHGSGAYGSPRGYGQESGLTIDRGGWSGGVGAYAAGGGGGAGVAILAQRGGLNGPTYNDYRQSFQYNPSHAGPFRPRLMGGFAPPPSSFGSGSR